MTEKKKLETLFKNNVPVYSFSKLDTANDCLYSYFKRYILKETGSENIYSMTGSVLHDTIEKMCNGEDVDAKKEVGNILNQCAVLDINFISEDTKDRWVKNIMNFIDNFEVPKDWNVETEKFVLFELDGTWIQGKIDLILDNGDKDDIMDWKSSSRFSKKDMLPKGRQLVMYKIGHEITSGRTVDKLGWQMLKYVNVCSMLKNGNKKEKMCERSQWVKECANNLTTDLKKLGMSGVDIEILIENAINENSIDEMPQEIRDKYWLEPCVVLYNVTPELEEECKEYIKTTVKMVESLPQSTDAEEFYPANPPSENDENKREFYCTQLCNYKNNCKYLKKYLDSKEELKQELTLKEDDFDSLLL